MAEGVVIVTGGSRGIGAEVAVAAARAGNDVVIGYHNKNRRATEVMERITALGRNAAMIRADLMDSNQIKRMVESAREFAVTGASRPLSTLVLNAAGGMEYEADEDYARAMNARGPWEMASRFLATGQLAGNTVLKQVVYVTSNPSHFYGHPKNTMPSSGYDVVARTKHEGEGRLRSSIRPDDGCRLLVATADLVDGTAGATLLRRDYKRATGDPSADIFADRDRQLEPLIGRGTTDATEFGDLIVDMIEDPDLPHGHTLYLPRPVLGEHVVPEAGLPFGIGEDPAMYTLV